MVGEDQEVETHTDSGDVSAVKTPQHCITRTVRDACTKF